MAEVYTDPAAQAAVLGIGDSPEKLFYKKQACLAACCPRLRRLTI